ncbi:MAG: 1-phosphofructokinase family hexose kinase [Candidatus Krumholzibacteriia bacterium]
MAAVVTLTVNPTIDKNADLERVVPEHKLRCRTVRREPGGGGINVARVVAELGGEVEAIWARGGHTGGLLEQLLDDLHVPHLAVSTAGETRENLIVYEESSGQQYRFGMPGPELSSQEADAFLDVLRGLEPAPAYLVASGSLPQGVDAGFYADVARVARDLGARCIVDTSGEALRRSVSAGIFLLKPNLRELQQLVQREVESDAEIESAARALIGEGKVAAVLVSIGAGGGVLVERDLCVRIPAPTVPIRSKIGAGDSTVGGIVHRLAQGDTVLEAARFGIAAGAAAVMTPGTELCRRADVERLYAHMRQDPPD